MDSLQKFYPEYFLTVRDTGLITVRNFPNQEKVFTQLKNDPSFQHVVEGVVSTAFEVHQHHADIQSDSRLTYLSRKISTWLTTHDDSVPYLVVLYAFQQVIEKYLNKAVGNLETEMEPLRWFALHCICAHWEKQRPSEFELSEGLSQHLLMTDAGSGSEQFAMPFRTFRLRVPKGHLRIRDNEGDDLYYTDFSVCRVSDSLVENKILLSVVATTPFDEFSAWKNTTLLLDTESSLQEQLAALVSEIAVMDKTQGYPVYILGRKTKPGGLSGLLQGFWTCVANTLLYLNSDETKITHPNHAQIGALRTKIGEAKKPAKKEKLRSVLRELEQTKVRILGADVPALAQRTGTSWNLDYATLVRGHWRNQPYGPQRAKRKRVWIRPHRRGPDGPAAAHHYKMG